MFSVRKLCTKIALIKHEQLYYTFIRVYIHVCMKVYYFGCSVMLPLVDAHFMSDRVFLEITAEG